MRSFISTLLATGFATFAALPTVAAVPLSCSDVIAQDPLTGATFAVSEDEIINTIGSVSNSVSTLAVGTPDNTLATEFYFSLVFEQIDLAYTARERYLQSVAKLRAGIITKAEYDELITINSIMPNEFLVQRDAEMLSQHIGYTTESARQIRDTADCFGALLTEMAGQVFDLSPAISEHLKSK